MRTVAIRDLRGAELEQYAGKQEMVGLTNHRVLVAVLLPATTAWVAHLVETNVSRIEQNLAEGEEELLAGNVTTLDEAVGADASAARVGDDEVLDTGPMGDVLSVVEASASEAIGRIRSAFGGARRSLHPSVRSVRIGDISGSVIEEASENGQTIALTNGRVLLGVLMPVSRRLVEHLVEENMSRVLMNIATGEKEWAAGPRSSLDEVIQRGDEARPGEKQTSRARKRRSNA